MKRSPAVSIIGDQAVAQQRYKEFLALWKNADRDRPELATAEEFLAAPGDRFP